MMLTPNDLWKLFANNSFARLSPPVGCTSKVDKQRVVAKRLTPSISRSRYNGRARNSVAIGDKDDIAPKSSFYSFNKLPFLVALDLLIHGDESKKGKSTDETTREDKARRRTSRFAILGVQRREESSLKAVRERRCL